MEVRRRKIDVLKAQKNGYESGPPSRQSSQPSSRASSRTRNKHSSSTLSLSGLTMKVQKKPAGPPANSKTPFLHIKPVHTCCSTSMLSRDYDGSNPSFKGFKNIGMIILIVGNLRLAFENYLKYGISNPFFDPKITPSEWQLSGLLIVVAYAHILMAYAIESAAKLLFLSSKHHYMAVGLLHTMNTLSSISLLSYVVYYYLPNPVAGTIVEFVAVILSLKLASYALTNSDLRKAAIHAQKLDKTQDDNEKESTSSSSSSDDAETLADIDVIPAYYAQLPYPQNVTLSNLLYFWFAPTLVYQPVYPKTERIRPKHVIRNLFELVSLCMLIQFLIFQYAYPIMQSCLALFFQPKLDYANISERLMKLASVSMMVWLIGFYAFFQNGLNLIAELTCFGNRTFYQQWWNSRSIGQYWTLWNKPVNQYFRHHVYVPLLARGMSRFNASVVVFFFSAVIHELLVGIPTHNIIGAAFFGMMSQVPLIMATENLQHINSSLGPFLGNCAFWFTFFLGQPTCAFLYYLAYNYKQNQ
ncbi:YALI0D07986p [Yarrowia lipolytica CLIB122]|uniref:O-acyltransferase n=2 Tax=Yarrowia lipolytica TaxID=4952 RepID=Q6C9V5_YARLI|nr:YALI0D07986p [Yarrowia lipolytica CLIB122]AOW03760.1 hypothetical protein YALI1_D10264g [Yarrowia lipolytica]KAB8284333.1 MBOAT, membrane-bound O-acyltransferase family-domain-containing protein [Yarrowia lipolytica]KAE8168974.1 MBOAT, membrane-bound O-acyltransferase family-domain-containing protein [Yarrowia lipolytica]KAJ8054650.1 MBOAT, membrane-bound O-acyltransferase family-domain-containing protein [Yarrowia lipolytica]QNP97711.1 Diacylglycerol O-acyltransferase 1 [Yarrowia lipolytic|eukprot:XP_502557.1 YALI0D07986p [Yarrowia lipolytica CLIB122]